MGAVALAGLQLVPVAVYILIQPQILLHQQLE